MHVQTKYINYLLLGRSGEFKDVFIDTMGTIIGILICYLICRLYKKRVDKNNSYDKIKLDAKN